MALDGAHPDNNVFAEIEGSFREDTRFIGTFVVGAAFGGLVFLLPDLDILALLIGIVFFVVCGVLALIVAARLFTRPRLRFVLTGRTYHDRWWTKEPIDWRHLDTFPTTVQGLRQVGIKIKSNRVNSVTFAPLIRQSANEPVTEKDFRNEDDFVRYLTLITAIKHPAAAATALNKARNRDADTGGGDA